MTGEDRPVAAMFVTPWTTKFQRMRPLITDLIAAGLEVRVLTHERFARAVDEAGGTFVDLYGARPVDDTSLPQPSRHIVHAVRHAEELAVEVSAFRARLIIHDTFAVIGRLVGEILQLPRVAVIPGHAPDPRAAVARHLRVGPNAPSEDCLRAVDVLRDRYGVEDASPLLHLSGRGAAVALYGQPPEWLTPEEQAGLGDVEFYGSLPPAAEIGRLAADPRPVGVYASFGTQGWHYWPEVVEAALRCVRDVVASMDGVRGLISLGGAGEHIGVAPAPGVEVVPFAPQWQALAGADVFVTHHGLYSTHEAVVSEVPMLGYPLSADQPALATRAGRIGVSAPLVDEPRAPLDPVRLRTALEDALAGRAAVRTALAEARSWELRTLAHRGEVALRVAGLCA